MKKQNLWLALILAGVCSTSVAGAEQAQPLQSIESAVKEFLRSERIGDATVAVTVRAMDSRLRLPACASGLDANWSPGSHMLGRVTVKISCTTPKPWQVHVQATVSRESTVWVLSRAVQRGDVLSAEMLEQQVITLGLENSHNSRSGAPVQSISTWLGYEFSRATGPGRLLTENMLVPRKLVSRGEEVRIQHRSNGLRLQTSGIALSDGTLDQRVQVRNKNSGKIIDAIVVSRGKVDII
jgi:flagella basal body P-ring formation protein FlgA